MPPLDPLFALLKAFDAVLDILIGFIGGLLLMAPIIGWFVFLVWG